MTNEGMFSFDSVYFEIPYCLPEILTALHFNDACMFIVIYDFFNTGCYLEKIRDSRMNSINAQFCYSWEA